METVASDFSSADDGSGRPHSVLAVGPFPPPVHGASRVTAAMVRRMRDENCAVTCIDTSGSRLTGCRYHATRVVKHLQAIREIVRTRPSLVYIGGAGGIGLLYQACVVVAARLVQLPVLFHHHSARYLHKGYLPLTVLLLACGDRVDHVVLSQDMASRLQSARTKSMKVHIWSNACHVDPVSPIAVKDQGTVVPEERLIVFGHLSNLSVEKGLHDVIDVMQTAERSGIPVKLLIAGPVSGRREAVAIERAIAEYGNAFSYLGPIEPEGVAEFMLTLDVFLFPSKYVHEAEPLVVLEAAAAGVPTIGLGNPSVSELVEGVGGEIITDVGSFSSRALELAPQLVEFDRRVRVQNRFLRRKACAARQVAEFLRAIP